MSTYTRLVLLRHGEAEGNRELRYLGATDAPLTPLGREQARQVAQAAALLRPAAIYSSPLLRARETANALAEVTRLDVAISHELREMDFGVWEGLTRAEARAFDPDGLAAWERGEDVAPPKGESLAAVRVRVVAFADELAARHPGMTLALVSHVGPIKALVGAALDLPTAGAQRMWLDPASICVVEWRMQSESESGQRGRGILRVFNAVSHLLTPPPWLGDS